MNLLPVRHLWGNTEPLESAIPRFASFGYRIIESAMRPDVAELRYLLDDHNLGFIAQAFTEGPTVEDHIVSLRTQVAQAKKQRALFINLHGGRDAFTLDQALHFYREALQIEHGEGVGIAHETHRGRIFYNPWRTAEVLRTLPELDLTCDYSHWVCVAERLLNEGDADILQLCAERCIHLHARVGYEEGPQVPDPSAPEYRRHLEAHETWWKQIWSAQLARGDQTTTVTPEFGPAGYLHTIPHTNVPVADQNTVVDWMCRRLKDTYAKWAEEPLPEVHATPATPFPA